MSLSLSKELLSEFSYNNVFVETGTFTGGGVQIALDCGFSEIHSIEIMENFYNYSKKLFEDTDKVKLYFGDSSVILWDIIKNIQEPITFFLDAHLANGSYGGTSEVPLGEELKFIKRHSINTHTILIDDRRGFGYNPNIDPNLSEIWKELPETEIIKLIKEINPDYAISYRDTKNAQQDLLVARI